MNLVKNKILHPVSFKQTVELSRFTLSRERGFILRTWSYPENVDLSRERGVIQIYFTKIPDLHQRKLFVVSFFF